MGNFNLADYDTVESRIKKFYKDHPGGKIHTSLVSDPNNIDTVVFEARLFIAEDNIMVSNGHAFEVPAQSGPNKTSHLENCETSAIGRALANFNYAGNKRASREEMEKVERGTTKPKDPDPDTPDPRQELLDEITELVKETNMAEVAKKALWARIKKANMGALTAIKAEVCQTVESEIKADPVKIVETNVVNNLDIF